MRSVADVKRAMVVGARVVMERYRDGELVYRDAEPRFVVHTQSNSFCLARSIEAKRGDWSWCDWPRSSEVSFPAPNKVSIERKGGKLVIELVA